MKTPTLESIEKKYRNAKKVRCLATDTIFELDFNSIHNDPLFIHLGNKFNRLLTE